MRIVLDTSVLVAAARSTRGASFAILRALPWRGFELALSLPLYVEWQAVLTRPEHLPPGQSPESVIRSLRYLASIAWRQEIYFRWRPCLPDPDDDLLLELAVAAQARHIVTHNPRDFIGAADFGVEVVSPKIFLQALRTAQPR